MKLKITKTYIKELKLKIKNYKIKTKVEMSTNKNIKL
jgi:hypothetical protein